MKTKWKWIPVPQYHISATEAWLSKMAAQGLLFQSFSGSFAKFEVSEPKPQRRYRLAVDPDYFKRPPEPMRELYEQAGWRYVWHIWGQSFFVFYSDDPLAVEPYTDEQSRADSLPQVVRICRKEAAHSAWMLMVYVLMTYVYFFYLPVLSFTRSWIYPFLLFFVFLSFISRLQNLFSIRRMKRWLEQGLSLGSFAPPKTQMAVQTVNWGLWAALLLFVIVLLPIDFLNLDRPLMPLDQATREMELLLLSDIEGPGYVPDGYERYPSRPTDLVDCSQDAWTHNNYYQRIWFPLAPTQHFIEQSGKTSGGTRVRLSIHRYDLLYAGQAGKALTELTGEPSYHEIVIPGTDRFLVTDSGDAACAALGRRVIQVSYRGNQALSDWYGQIVEMLRAEK